MQYAIYRSARKTVGGGHGLITEVTHGSIVGPVAVEENIIINNIKGYFKVKHVRGVYIGTKWANFWEDSHTYVWWGEQEIEIFEP